MSDDHSDFSTNEIAPFFSSLKGKKSRLKPERIQFALEEPPDSPELFSWSKKSTNSDESVDLDEKSAFTVDDFSNFNRTDTENVSNNQTDLLNNSFLLDFGDLKLSEQRTLDTISEEVVNGHENIRDDSINLKTREISTRNLTQTSPETQKHSFTRSTQKTGSTGSSILNTIKQKALEQKTPLRDDKYDTTALVNALVPNDSILLLQDKLHPIVKSTKPFTTPARKFGNSVAPFRQQFPKTVQKIRQDLNTKFDSTTDSNKENGGNFHTIVKNYNHFANNEPFRTPHQVKSQPINTVCTSVIKPPRPTRYEGTFQILNRNYIIQRKLGQGGSCEVYEAVDAETSNIYAIKCVNLAVDQPMANEFLSEINTLAKLQATEYVIKMFASEQIDDKLYVVMEKGEMDLAQLIEKRQNLHMAMIIYYWIEMLNAVKCIHDNGVIHSDLKPANFLLVNGRLKLIDFGIASVVQGDSTSIIKNTQAGTISYISPEALMDTRDFSVGSPTSNNIKINISYKSDVWSLGCILYKFIYGKTPFGHITNRWAKISVIMDKNHKIDFPERDDIPPKVMQTLKDCLIFEMRKRPSVAELLKIKYICYRNCD